MTVDSLKAELDKRSLAYKEFGEKFGAITKLRSLTLRELEEEVRKLLSTFKDDLEPVLSDELFHLKSHIADCGIGAKNPVTLCKWLREKGLQTIYPNVDILLRMFVCTPVTNSSAERSFSSLKRIKDHFRSAVQQTKLNALALLCIETDLTRSLDFTETIEAFSWTKARKKKF